MVLLMPVSTDLLGCGLVLGELSVLLSLVDFYTILPSDFLWNDYIESMKICGISWLLVAMAACPRSKTNLISWWFEQVYL